MSLTRQQKLLLQRIRAGRLIVPADDPALWPALWVDAEAPAEKYLSRTVDSLAARGLVEIGRAGKTTGEVMLYLTREGLARAQTPAALFDCRERRTAEDLNRAHAAALALPPADQVASPEMLDMAWLWATLDEGQKMGVRVARVAAQYQATRAADVAALPEPGEGERP